MIHDHDNYEINQYHMIHNHIEMVWCTFAEKSIQYGT